MANDRYRNPMDEEALKHALEQYKQFYYFFLEFAYCRTGDKKEAEFIVNKAVYDVIKSCAVMLDEHEFKGRVLYKLRSMLEGRK